MEPGPASTVDEADLLRHLLDCGEQMPDTVADRILGLGSGTVPALLRVLESDEFGREDARGGGWGPVHAAKLLGRIQPREAVDPLLRVLARCDCLDLLYSAIIFALKEFGSAALEPVLSAHAAATSDDQRTAIADVLSGLQVRDPRIFAALLRTLEADPVLGAGLLVEYGDPAALPHLEVALDGWVVDDDGGPLANGEIIELAAAIEELGATLSEDQVRKARAAGAARRSFRAELQAGAARSGVPASRGPGLAKADPRKKLLRKMRKRAQRRNRR